MILLSDMFVLFDYSNLCMGVLDPGLNMVNRKFSPFNDDDGDDDSFRENLKMVALIVLIVMFMITWIGLMINETIY